MEYIEELKKLAAGELLCGLQYKMASEALVGPGKNFSYIQDHCAEHYEEEFEHYEILVNEIMKAGEAPYMAMKDIMENANPELTELTSFNNEAIRDFFIKAEQDATAAYVEFYKQIENDPELMDLADLISGIISDEKEHELDFRRVENEKPEVKEGAEEESEGSEGDMEEPAEEAEPEEEEEEIEDPIKESNLRYLFDME